MIKNIKQMEQLSISNLAAIMLIITACSMLKTWWKNKCEADAKIRVLNVEQKNYLEKKQLLSLKKFTKK